MKNRIILAVLLLLLSWPVAEAADSELRRKVAQMVIAGFRGMDGEGEEVRSLVRDLRVGGVIYFDRDVPTARNVRNVRSPEQLKALSESLRKMAETPLFIAIDQEGGRVSRLKENYGFPPTVTALSQGQINDTLATVKWAGQTAKTLRDAGINVDFAPCVDVNVNPDCPVIGRIGRSFSDDPARVLTHAGIWIRQLRKAGVLTSLKHFPGHGSSRVDSHLGLTDITDTWQREKELMPYRTFIGQGYGDFVMVGHLVHRDVDPDYPASLSAKWIDGVLRRELGFRGVVITDDLNMGAITDNYTLETALELAINAGVDMIILGNNGPKYEPGLAAKAIGIICTAVEQGRISPERIDQAYGRVMALKRRIH